MQKRFRWGLLVALISLMSLVLAACGDSTTATTTGGGAATTAAGGSAATTAAGGGAAMTTAAAGGAMAGSSSVVSLDGVTTVPAVASGNKTGISDTEIKVASWGPQSGSAAGYGIVDRVIDAYFKQVNEQGGIYGRKIKFAYEDDAYTAAKTEPIVKKFVEQENVFGFIGGVGTANNLKVKDYLAEKGIPNVGFATGSGALVNPVQKNAFGLLTNYTFEGTLLAQYAQEKLGAKKVAIFYQNDGFGKEGQAAFSKTAKEKGLDVAAEVSYETGATDLAAQALKLQQSGADTVYLQAVPGPGAIIVKEMDKLGYKPKLLVTFVLNDPSFFNNAGKGADGAITTSFAPLPDDLSNPKVAKYQDFMKKYLPQEQIGSFSLWGYIGAEIFVEGLKRAGKDISRENFIAALESITDWKGSLATSITYGANNRAPIKSAYIIQFKDSKFTKLTEPLEAK